MRPCADATIPSREWRRQGDRGGAGLAPARPQHRRFARDGAKRPASADLRFRRWRRPRSAHTRRNETAFSAFGLLPRPLRGAPARDLSLELFGKALRTPVLIGPTGLSGLFWPDGERAAARAAAGAGTIYCASHASVVPLEAIAACGASPRWMQVFVYRDRGFTRAFAERAAAATYDALVLTVDNQLTGNRERDMRNGFTIPPRFGPIALAGMAIKVGWLWHMRRELKRITFANYVDRREAADLKSLAQRMARFSIPRCPGGMSLSCDAAGRDRYSSRASSTRARPRRPSDHGIDGLIVSNHGGRQLDGAPATIEALPGVVEAVAGRMPVLIDGGIRRGADVVRAIALGARRLPDRPPPTLGSRRCRRGRRRPRPRHLPPRDRPRAGPLRHLADRGHRTRSAHAAVTGAALAACLTSSEPRVPFSSLREEESDAELRDRRQPCASL